MSFNPDTLNKYPDEPGVYLMKDKENKVLYVGKANSIKKRVKQYFSEQDTRPLIPYLIKSVHTIDTIVVNTEKEALLLENNLIKKHKPKYNVLLKDDKTYVSLVLTKHKWPMLKLIRFKKRPPKGTYFGPYTNARAARETLDLINRLFPLRQCSDQELVNRQRPCILYDIKRCSAPCMNLCTQEEYKEHVLNAKHLLRGQSKKVLTDLKSKMQKASDALEFEQANVYLQLIKKIEHVIQVQHVDNSFSYDADVISLYREGADLLIAKLVYRLKKLVASEHFSFSNIVSLNREVLENFILQHYTKEHLPPQIIVSEKLEEKNFLQEILSEELGKKVEILFPIKGEKKKLIEIATKNAKSLFAREKDQRALEEKRLLDLQEVLQLNHFPHKIECFDTSNLSGSSHVACMVAFTNGKKDKSKNRLFNIKSAKSSDDYGAMKEVLFRHYKKQKENHNLPNLIIIDGGKGHLNLALEVLDKLNLANIDLISLAKHSSRHDKGLTEEKVFVPHLKDPIIIDPTSPLLFLLQNIRDEAHRVAISFQRKKRKITTSELDQLQGIGPVKKKALLKHFKSVKNLKNASIEEIKKVKELNEKDIATLLEFKKK